MENRGARARGEEGDCLEGVWWFGEEVVAWTRQWGEVGGAVRLWGLGASREPGMVSECKKNHQTEQILTIQTA